MKSYELESFKGIIIAMYSSYDAEGESIKKQPGN